MMQSQSFLNTYPQTITLDAKLAVKLYSCLVLPFVSAMPPLAWNGKDPILAYAPSGNSYTRFMLEHFFPDPTPAHDLCCALDKLGKAAEDHQPVTLTFKEYQAAYHPDGALNALAGEIERHVHPTALILHIKEELGKKDCFGANEYLASKVEHYASPAGVSLALHNLADIFAQSHALSAVVRPAIADAMQATSTERNR